MKPATIRASPEVWTYEPYQPNDLSFKRLCSWQTERPALCVVCERPGININRSKVFICSDECRLKRSNRARRIYNKKQRRRQK